jgi:hypothetical protein
MSAVFGEARTIPASDTAKRIMKSLVSKNLFNEQRDVWWLGAALGIAMGQEYTSKEERRETFQGVGSLDPERIFAAIIMGLYPQLTSEERIKKLVNHAEWGIREIARKEENGTLDFSALIP